MNSQIRNALTALRQGQVILYPTETVWGLGCDATHEIAIKKIFRIKGRQEHKPFILLIDSVSSIQNYLNCLPANSENLLNSEESQTVIFPGGKNVNPLVLGPDGSIAFRLAKHPFCTELLSEFRKPLISTSANLSGQQAPQNFSEINPSIISKTDYIVEWIVNDEMNKKPSRIVRVSLIGEVEVVRG